MVKDTKEYITKLGNKYSWDDPFIDIDMPYGDYNELQEQNFQNLAPTMDGRCGYQFDNCKDEDIITVTLVLNPENEQKTLYCYVPKTEVSDFSLEIEKQVSSKYTDYQDTLMDNFERINKKYFNSEFKNIDTMIEWGKKEIITKQEEIKNLTDSLKEVNIKENDDIEELDNEIYSLENGIEEALELKLKIVEIEKKCTWNSWNSSY